jgi:hypothetical protein
MSEAIPNGKFLKVEKELSPIPHEYNFFHILR